MTSGGERQRPADARVNEHYARLYEAVGHDPDLLLALNAIKTAYWHCRDETARLRVDVERATANSLTDELTGLPNRRALMADAQRYGRRQGGSERRASDPAAWIVALMDLDGFKKVNDTHGHEQGDRVLVMVANCLLSSVRAGDRVYRLGGDEFAVVGAVRNSGGVELFSSELALRFHGHLQEVGEGNGPIFLPTGYGVSPLDRATAVLVRGSFGIHVTEGPALTDMTYALHQADIAMYAAKNARSGENPA